MTEDSEHDEKGRHVHSRLRLMGLVLAAGAVVYSGNVAGASGQQQVLHGTFSETATGAGLGYSISGSAKMTVSADATAVKVNVAGLDPAKHYSSHLHDGTCAAGGGGHYMHDTSGEVTPPNEIWLSTSADPLGGIDSNPGGVAHGNGTSEWAARLTSSSLPNARSVIVHEPGGARIACADLT